jgi:hypothetical protein
LSAIGFGGIVVGLSALVRVGLNTHDLSRPTMTVFGIEHTPLLAVGEVGFGVVMILAAMTPIIGRVVVGLLSSALTAFGTALIVASRTDRLHHWFGVVEHQGWSYVIVGAVGLLAALTFPAITRRTITQTVPAATGTTRAPEPNLPSMAPPNQPAPGEGAPMAEATARATPPADLAAPMADHLHICLSDCGSTFDTRDAADGDIRFCGLGHAQRWHANTWELVPADADHEGLHTPVGTHH